MRQMPWQMHALEIELMQKMTAMKNHGMRRAAILLQVLCELQIKTCHYQYMQNGSSAAVQRLAVS